MKVLRFFSIFILFFSLSSLNAEEYDKRNKITKNLRCLICQGQSVYDSDSEFANSLKIVVDKKLKEGLSEDQIYEYLLLKEAVSEGIPENEFLDSIGDILEYQKAKGGYDVRKMQVQIS